MASSYEVRRIRRPWTHSHGNFESEAKRLNLATVLRVSVYSLPGPMAYPLAMMSFLAFLTAFRGKWSGRLRAADYMLSAPDFMRKPVAEMLGLGVAMQAASGYGWDGRGPQSVDSLRQFWGERGSRPDLLFSRTGTRSQFVGEAKGIIARNQRQSAPQSDERRWLNKLADWYRQRGLQYYLSVAIATPDGVIAHLYDPGEPLEVYPDEILEAAIRSRESTLWETGPASGQVFLDREVRGEWRSVRDVGTGTLDRPSWMFLGVLSEELPTDVEDVGERWQVSAKGRLVVLLHQSDESTPPGLADAESLFLEPGEGHGDFVIRRDGRIIAQGYPGPGGKFIVMAGAELRSALPSMPQNAIKIREQLRRDGRVQPAVAGGVHGRLSANVPFDSPSLAAKVVLGISANGWAEWRTPDGRRLDEVY